MKILKIISLLTVGLLLFSACEKIEPPYTEDNSGGGGEEAVQKVLLEDYTGHLCVNCPTAAATAEKLQELYGDRLVVMAVHAGYFARPVSDMNQDFRTDAGEAWDTYFGNSGAGNPNGLVNRTEVAPGNYIYSPTAWGSAIAGEMEKDAKALITIHSNFAQNTLSTTVTAVFNAPLGGVYNLLVCITQDSITGPQLNNNDNIGETPLIDNYVFMHVLRFTNGTWGIQLTDDNPLQTGKKYEKTVSIPFENDWMPENCHVVAFIFNMESKTIVQVEEANVIE